MSLYQNQSWLFRVASKAEQGGGHVARSLILANSWKENVIFCLDEDSPYLSLVAEQGYECISPTQIDEKYAGIFLDVYSTEDFDFYRSKTDLLVVIEGFKDFYDNADIYIRPYTGNFSDHDGRIVLEGLEYALINPIYGLSTRKVSHDIETITICMGRFDSKNTTEFLLNALDRLSNNFHTKIVLGSGAKHLDSVRNYIENQYSKTATLYLDLPDMVQVYQTSDLLFSSGGGTSLEAVVAKTPVIIMSFTQDQKTIANDLHNINAAHYIGEFQEMDIQGVLQAINDLMPMEKRRKLLNNAGRIDTNGACKIYNKIVRYLSEKH